MDEQQQTRLEAELAGLFDDPPAELRARVARRVAHELEVGQAGSGLTYALAVAAAIVLWAGLSRAVSRDQSYAWRSDPPAVTAEEIKQLLPGISEAEARRQAWLLFGPVQSSSPRAERRAAAFSATSF